jgi:hypothetical protein
MPKIASRLRKAQVRQDGAHIVKDPKSAVRSEDAKRSKGHDERGRYGKSVADPDADDDYKDRT